MHRTAMPPKRELSIRLRSDLREALDRAIVDQGQSLTALVESALAQFFGMDGPEQGQNLADRVRMLEQRVATLEGTAMQRTAPHRDTTPQTAPTAGAYRGEGEGEGQHPKADGGRWFGTGGAVALARTRGFSGSAGTLKRWGKEGDARLGELGLGYRPHGTRDKTLATFEDLRWQG